VSSGAGTAGATAGRTPTQNALSGGRADLINTDTPDTTRQDYRAYLSTAAAATAGQAGSYA